jgi:cytochrome c oxidase assembly factor CtaG
VTIVWDPGWMAGVALAGLDYGLAVRLARRRGLASSPWRAVSFAAGLVLIALALFSPLEHYALTRMLSLHLLQNVMLADWAPPLLVLGLAPWMAEAFERRRAFRIAVHPAVALPYWLAAWYVLHLPPVYDYALRHGWALGGEHLVFLTAGVLFWWPVLRPGLLRPPARVAYLFAAFVLASPVALLIALASRPIYDFYASAPKLWGWSALTDQEAGGITMAVEQSVLLFAALGYAFNRLLSEDGDTALEA